MRILWLSLALSLTVAHPVGATVVSGAPGSPDPREAEAVISIDDRDGVRNRLDVRLSGSRVVVREAGDEPLEASGTCRSLARAHVVCGGGHLEAELGGGDDTLVARIGQYEQLYVVADGGAGDDVLRAAGGGVTFTGGDGNDVLRGRAGWDTLVGGAGDDRLYGGRGGDALTGDGHVRQEDGAPPVAAGDDVIDGGPGRDFATWTERRAPIRVDLASRRLAGRTGERDRVRGIEDVAGGHGRDTLRGTDGPNDLLGGRGADRLDGRGGDDVVDAGWAIGRAYLGGNDHAADRLSCGSGRDRIVDPYVEALPRDCERLTFNEFDVLGGGTLIAQPQPLPRGRLRFHVTDCDCAGHAYRRVVVRAGGREIGRSRLKKLPIARGRFIAVRMRRPLPRRGYVQVVITGFHPVGDEDGNLVTEKYRFVYRLRR